MNRSAAIDRLRGLAIALMLLDHVLELWVPSAWPIRFTVTRFSMPLFFVLSGHLTRRINIPRLLIVAIMGIALPFYAQWLDKPNVLYWYVLGVFFLHYTSRRVQLFTVIVALSLYANKYALVTSNSYAPMALLGLMIVGKRLPRTAFQARFIPAFMERIGRYPLSIYVIHILIFETIRRIL